MNRPLSNGDQSFVFASSMSSASHAGPLRFLIHLEVANQHRLSRAAAIARTLMKGGHEAAISYEPRISFRLAPTDTETIFLDDDLIIQNWIRRIPDVQFFCLDTYCENSLEGIHAAQNLRASKLAALIGDFAPSWIMLWGGEFEYQQGSLAAIETTGMQDRTLYFEVAWLPQQEHMYFDIAGTNSRSSLVEYSYPGLSRTQMDLLHDAKRRFRHLRGGVTGPIRNTNEIFVPLQIETDTSFRIGAPFKTNSEFIRFLEGWLPPNHTATLKLHPKERIRGYPPVPVRRNFRLITSGSLDRMILAADHVLGVNSTVLLEAAMLGKHTVALGRGLFTGSGAVIEARITDDAAKILSRPIDNEAQDRFLYELLFRRQVSLSALECQDYAHLATREPFATILRTSHQPSKNARFVEKLSKGESMITVGRSRIAKTAVLDVEQGGEIVIANDSDIRNNAVLEVSGRYNGSIRIGNNSVIGIGSWLQGSGKIEIGDDVIIGPYAAIVSTNHQYEDVSVPIAKQPLTTGAITIENDVWIGAHVTVAMNVRIGAHSIIGANSFVNSDIPPYSVAVGSPARVIRSRKP
ncbi:hypothetical protein [Paracoccus litorisediminis]|nr:hypothetical protein [Paracoccus litorisediminis]